jgi:hypothetical protein
LHSPFVREVLRYVNARRTTDRTAALDQIGGRSFAAMRRDELAHIPGAGHLAVQYGWQMADELHDLGQRQGLRFENRLGARYHREVPNDELARQCRQIYESNGHSHPADRVLFFNSNSAVDRLKAFWSEPESSISAVRDLPPGLVAVEFAHSDAVEYASRALKIVGGRPAGALMLKRSMGEPSPVGLDDRLDNREVLLRLSGEGPGSAVRALGGLPPGHPAEAVASTAAALLRGLGLALAPQADAPRFRHNALLGNALDSLEAIARALPTLIHDSTRMASAYRAMMEELFIVMAEARPYAENDFKQAADGALRRGLGTALDGLNIAPPEPFLTSSGMDALTEGLIVGRILSQGDKIEPLSTMPVELLPDYHETVDAMMGMPDTQLMGERPGKGPVFSANLNSNTPPIVHRDRPLPAPGPSRLIDAILEKVRTKSADTPAITIVLDHTIERPRADGGSDLADVLRASARVVNDGSLKFVLCRSHQKFTSLGSGKIAAGELTVIARDDERTRTAMAQLRAHEQNLGMFSSDESQLLTHFLHHGGAIQTDVTNIKPPAWNAPPNTRPTAHSRG